MTVRNPKQEGTPLFDCKPQCGPCPVACDQCFYNRPGAFSVDPDQPHMPTVEEVGDGVLRINSGHDSNVEREKAISMTDAFPRRFFNTSIPRFDFPAPVVFTANPREEKSFVPPPDPVPDNLMFVRLRVSSTNLELVGRAVDAWTAVGVPVVLTFMAYCDREPEDCSLSGWDPAQATYEWQVRHTNSYWCPTKPFIRRVLADMRVRSPLARRLVTMCGTPDSRWCRDCLNCLGHYHVAAQRLRTGESKS